MMAIACAIAVCAGTAFAANITTIEGDSSGALVTLDSNPVITAIGSMPGSGDGYTYTNYAILAQDSTGSVELFGHLPTGSPTPAVGDTINVAGTFSPYNSIPEIETLTSFSVTGTAPVPAPLPITVAQLQGEPDDTILGYYLSLSGVTITPDTGDGSPNPVPGSFPTHSNGDYYVNDSLGNQVVMYQYASSYSAAGSLGGTVIPTGPVNVTGTIDYYAPDSEVEFIPFSVTAVPEPASASLLILGGAALIARRRGRRV